METCLSLLSQVGAAAMLSVSLCQTGWFETLRAGWGIADSITFAEGSICTHNLAYQPAVISQVQCKPL